MMVDVHTHFFRPRTDFGPKLLADLARCGVEPRLWGDVGRRHLETTRAADVAIDFPDLTIVLAHMGHPWEGETIAVIRRNANVFADVSALYYRPWQLYNSMRLLVEYRAEAKVLFGSDFPFATTADSLQGLRDLNTVVGQSGLPRIPEDVIEGTIHQDALSVLGLKHPTAAPQR